MAQEDDLRALGKIMDFLRAVSIILAIMNVYWYCYEAMRMWGVTIGVVDRILINFNRTGGLFHSLHQAVFASAPGTLMSGNQGRKGREDELEQDLDGSCRRLLSVLPQLVGIIVAYITFGQCYDIHLYDDSGLYLPVDGRTLDKQTHETQPHGGCLQ